MKGITEAMMKIIFVLILGGLAFIIILWILNYFGVNLVTPLCRTFCFPVMEIVSALLKYVIIGYLLSPASMCSFCG